MHGSRKLKGYSRQCSSRWQSPVGQPMRSKHGGLMNSALLFSFFSLFSNAMVCRTLILPFNCCFKTGFAILCNKSEMINFGYGGL